MSLVQLTLSGSTLILLIVLVRALALHRLPKETFPALWAMAALRLLVPFSLPVPFCTAGTVRHLSTAAVYLLTDAPLAEAAEILEGTPAAGGAALLRALGPAGTVLLAAYFAVLYARARRKFRVSIPCDVPAVRRWLAGQSLHRPLTVRQSDQIASPLTYGVLRPVILLPKNTARDGEPALPYILTHELIHVRRFDGVKKLLFAAALCVHWFNPLVWVMYFLANRDLELSCDARVLEILGRKEKAPYALALLCMEETRSRGLSLYSHFSKLAIEERIEAIMKYKKTSVLAAAFAAVLVVGATTAFAAPTADGGEVRGIAGKNETETPLSIGQIYSAEKIPLGENDGEWEYFLTPKGSGLLEENVPMPKRTEEEMRQILADIESGKIQPFEMPDDPNVSVRFVEYADGSCTMNDTAFAPGGNENPLPDAEYHPLSWDDLTPIPLPEDLAESLRELNPDIDIDKVQCFSFATPEGSTILISFGKTEG